MPYLVAQVDLGNTFSNAWARAVDLTPKILLFLLILIVGWIVARAVSRILDTVLEKIGFDRWVERGGVKRALSSAGYDASDLLAKVVFYALFLVVLQLAFGVFGPNPVSNLIEGIVSYLPNIFVAILIVVVTAYLAAAVRDIVTGAVGGLDFGRTLATGAYVAIVVIGLFAALDQLEIAEDIVNGLFYALLAIVAGSAIVAIGGGGIQPMRAKWEGWLRKSDAVVREASSPNPPPEPSAPASPGTPPPG